MNVRARAAAQALSLDGELADAHCTVAYGKLVYDFDWAGAVEVATAFLRAGRYEEAVDAASRAVEIDSDAARDCLEQASEQRAGAAYGIKGSFLFKPLRSHPSSGRCCAG